MLDSLVRLLSREFDVVSAVTDGVSVVAAAARHAPDVLVLNIAMPGLNGIAAARRVQASGAAVKIVFVTTLYEREFVDGALSVGEVGFVLKDRVATDLIPAIRTVLTGRAFVSAPAVR
jgi:DNA-binding NarL/FixJ family response regulator